jgi:hypothetical protein
MLPAHPDQIKRSNNPQRYAVLTGSILLLMLALLLVAALASGSTVGDLLQPAGALLAFDVIVIAVISIGVGLVRQAEGRSIKRLYAEGAWAQWQYSAAEWQQTFERRYQNEKKGFRAAACGNLFSGPIFGGVFIVSGYFMRNSPYSSLLIGIGIALAVGIVLVGFASGLSSRSEAQRHYSEAKQVPTPYIIFGREGYYHQVNGYQWLRRLRKVEVKHKDEPELYFYLWGGRYRVRHSVPIPHGYEADAERLCQRYVTEFGL